MVMRIPPDGNYRIVSDRERGAGDTSFEKSLDRTEDGSISDLMTYLPAVATTKALHLEGLSRCGTRGAGENRTHE